MSGGGLAVSVRELAALLEADFEVRVLTSRLRDHFADDRGVLDRVSPVGAARYQRATLLDLVLAIRQADLILAHWTFSFRRLATASSVLGPLLRTTTVVVVHTAPDHRVYNRLRWLPELAWRLLLGAWALALRQCDAVIGLGRSHAAALRRVGLDVTHVLPLFMPDRDEASGATDASVPRWLPSRRHQRRTVIGVVGELSRLKGFDRLPALLDELTPTCSVRIAGAGPLKAWLTRRIEALDVDQRAAVSMVGLLEPAAMNSFYRGLDVLLVVSRTEAQSRAVLEAMLAGVLVAAPPVGGIGDLVEDGVTGAIVDIDHPVMCRDRVRELLRDTSGADEVRDRARAMAIARLLESRCGWQALVGSLAANPS